MQRCPDQSELVYLVYRLLQCLFFFFELWSRDTGIQELLSLLKVNKNKPKTNSLNSAVLVHVFLDNFKEYPIYFFLIEILLILHCEE